MSPDTAGGLARWLPGLHAARTYDRSWLRADLLAGSPPGEKVYIDMDGAMGNQFAFFPNIHEAFDPAKQAGRVTRIEAHVVPVWLVVGVEPVLHLVYKTEQVDLLINGGLPPRADEPTGHDKRVTSRDRVCVGNREPRAVVGEPIRRRHVEERRVDRVHVRWAVVHSNTPGSTEPGPTPPSPLSSRTASPHTGAGPTSRHAA